MGAKFLKIILLSFFSIPILFLQPSSALAALITDIRFWSAPDRTRIVLDLSEPIQYESSSQENPPEFYLELKGISLPRLKRMTEVKDRFLTKIGLTELGEDKVKLTLYQKKPLSATVFLLKPYQEKPDRLVIDLVDVVQEKKEIEERQKQKQVEPKGTKIIVIDPGHGGEDPGAGRGKTMEKNVVLQVGVKVVQLLNQEKDIKAFLTRKGDYFIELKRRREIAEQYKADLFVSLHADASFNPQARGSSVYCLSLSGATDEAARILADKENRSNFLGGVISKPITNEKDKVEPILVDLAQNDTMRESFRFAEILLKDLKNVNTLKYSSYRQANFIVLRAEKILFPSVLIETAYITNKEDERLLNSNQFQDKIAKAITASIKSFFGSR